MLARTPLPTQSMHQSFEGLPRPALHRRARSLIPFDLSLHASERMVAALLFGAYACLRLLLVRTLSVNSDEPQHAHVAWAWSKGLVPYRDVFDNHMPLFHMLAAPLFRLMGETPDILVRLRLAMVPLSVLALWLAWRVGRTLWDKRVAAWAIALTAVCPLYLRGAGEFRTDVLWGVAWLAAMALAVGGRWTPRRAWGVGIALGVAFAVSLKSMLLVAAAGAAWAAIHACMAQTDRPSLRIVASSALRIAFGACIVPAVVVAVVATKGGLAAMHYGVLTHNMLSGLGDATSVSTRLPRLLGLGLLFVAALWPVRRAADPAREARRAFVVASAALYGLLLLGGWPLLTPQDSLPVAPLLVLGLVAWWFRVPVPSRLKVAASGALVALGIAAVFWRHGALDDRTAGFRSTLATVLSITTDRDPVLDDKGSTIYRQRPYYLALETITLERLRRGLLVDDIAQRLVGSDTHVVWSNRLPVRDRAFVDAHYLPLGRDLHVAGNDLGWLPTGTRREVYVLLPGAYALLSNGAHATLDGVAYATPRLLGSGSHTIVTTDAGHYLLVWAPAAMHFPVAAR